MSDFDPIDDTEPTAQVAPEPVRDSEKPDPAYLRGLWYANPAKYRQIVKEHGLEPGDIWPQKPELPVQHNMQRFAEGAFGHTLPPINKK
jgi:hypothetical protein